LVKSIVDAHLSSQEETIFGEFLEGLAIFVCSRFYNGTKSSAEGIDLEFVKDDIRYLVSIKSGPNWGNNSQINRMIDNFNKAKRILKSNTTIRNIVAINGCCYGRSAYDDKGHYIKLCGQNFWEFISGDKNLYLDIIKPLGSNAREKNEDFLNQYTKALNKLTQVFSEMFCDDGTINWEKIIRFNSQSK